MKKNILFGVLISGVCIYFAFRGINFSALAASITAVNYLYIIPVVLIIGCGHFLRCYRWGKILETLVRYDQKTLFVLGSIGYMAVNILPARLGEFARPYLVKKRSGIKMSASMATIIVERVFDLLSVMLILFVVLLKVALPPEVVKAGITMLTVSLSIFIALIFLAVKRDSSISKIDTVLNLLPQKFAAPLNRIVHSFIDGLQILPNIGKTLYVFFLSLLLWTLVSLSAYVLFLGFGFKLSVFNGFAITVIIALGVILPAAPGFIGTFHYACKIGLVAFGVSDADALSYAILLHFFQMMPVVLLGLAMLPFQKVSLPGIIQHADTDNSGEGA
jgi:glycosyltransferase 2 family protein